MKMQANSLYYSNGIFKLKYWMSFNFERLSEPHLLKDAQETHSQLYNFKSKQIVNTRGQSFIQWKCLIFKALSCFANTICLICACSGNNSNETEQVYDLLTLFSIASAIFHGFKMINQEHIHRSIYGEMYEMKKGNIFWGILVGIFYLIHPSSLTSGFTISIDEFEIKLNSILTMIVILRLIGILHFLIVSSRFYGARVARVLQIYAVKEKLSVGYAIRCFYKVKGLRMPFIFLLMVLILVPFIRVQFQESLGEEASFIQEIYDTVVTMTTVGYGDIDHSQSLMIRAGIILIILAGSFTSSLLALTVVNFFKLTPSESRAYLTHQRLTLLEDINQSQRAFLKQLLAKKRSGIPISQGQSQLNSQIANKQRQLRQNRFNQSLTQYYASQFLNVQSQIKKIVQKQLLIDNLMQFYFTRRRRGEEEIKSGRSRKRADDSKRIGKLFDLILNKDE